MINRGKTCAFLRNARKVLQIEGVAEFDSDANGIVNVYSVAVTRRFINSGGYPVDWTR